MSALHMLTLLCLGAATAAAAAPLTPVDLRVEYKVNPLGIDAATPRLTWRLEATANGARQTAYHILVASSAELLAKDQGDLWDSGRVDSSNTALIPYAGKPLTSRMHCHWKVCVWDGNGVDSGWSAPAHWSMGLLSASDWSAQWIGYDAPETQVEPAPEVPSPLEGAAWLWHAAGPQGLDQPEGRAYFRKTFELDQAVKAAQLAITVDNECKVFLNGKDANEGGGAINAFNRIFTVDVTGRLTTGVNVLAVEALNQGDTANPAGMIARLTITLADDSEVIVASDTTWKSAPKRGSKAWTTTNFDDATYAAPQIVAKLGEGPWNPKPDPGLTLPPPPYLRRDFAAEKGIRRATVYATALGLYELHLNGQRVGEDYLTPGWTDYRKRVPYQTYDVTALVKEGPNALGAILADGWYAGYIGFRLLNGLDKPRGYYGEEPRLAVQLEIEYADGRVERVTTDPAWKAAYGPIREADLLMGEARDLRRELAGWNTPGYDDSAWAAVAVSPAPDIRVEAHAGEPVQNLANFTAKKKTEPQPGVYVYDLGQNIVGWARLQVQGADGQKIQVRQSERLQDDGTLYTVALRKARAIDTYTLSGNGVETLEPAFTFHGFQYVEITGVDAPLPLEAVTGVVIGSAITQTGHFESSEPLLNQLFHNIVWGQRGNYLEAPTDCPQRDERLGWTGDAQFFMPTSAYTADIGAFFTKWLVDLVQDAQFPDGSFPDIAPDIGLGSGNVAWGDAAMICTYEMYRYYGDRQVIEEHYDRLVKGMDYLESTSENFIRKKLGYGDWLNLGGNAKDEVICTAYFAYLAGLMAEMGEVIGRTAEAERFRVLHGNIRDAFIQHFVLDDGSILESSQTGYALAFTMDLLPEDKKALAAKHFEKEIARFDNHLATGFIGTPRLLPGLQAAGRLDLAYQLLLTKTFPSWLFQVTLGATTMWERWDGWTPDKGFQDPGMNSFNHYAFGAVGQFLYEAVGGIQPLAPGFAKVQIAPHPGGGLTHASVRYNSIRGEIVSGWKQDGAKLTMNVTVPPNVTAEIEVPAGADAKVTVSDPTNAKPLGQAEGRHRFEVTGGQYTFTVE
jgi:alpha-L-rhamnosidase